VLQDFAADPVIAVHTQDKHMMQAHAEGFGEAIELARRCLVLSEGLSEVVFSTKGRGHAATP
jgi:hypothetical protein